VRRPDEWNRGHIAEAELVTIDSIYGFGKALKDLNLSPDEDTIFVCASGQRSAMACEIALLTGLKQGVKPGKWYEWLDQSTLSGRKLVYIKM